MTAAHLANDLPIESNHLTQLHASLERNAQDDDVLDIAYRTVDSAVGRLLLAATPRGLLRIAFSSEGHDAVLQSLSDRISPRVLRAPARLEQVTRELDDYFEGRRRTFEVPLDWSLSKGFRRNVLQHLANAVGYGTTASYASIAELSGSRRAVRAVGTACATNPIPIVVPCHRVTRSDGSAGAYRGGSDAKRKLLDLEHAR